MHNGVNRGLCLKCALVVDAARVAVYVVICRRTGLNDPNPDPISAYASECAAAGPPIEGGTVGGASCRSVLCPMHVAPIAVHDFQDTGIGSDAIRQRWRA